MIERYETIVPVSVESAMTKGTILEFDSTNAVYKPLTTGAPVGVLMEDVAKNQVPATAKVLFHGVVYADELQGAITEALKANLRKVGIFVEVRASA